MFKPFLAALVLPPLGPLLLGAFGLFFAARGQRAGLLVAALALALLWLLSCHGAAVWLGQNALPQFLPTTVPGLKAAQVQAIVVLGGGVRPVAPEYGEPQLSPATAERLRYGMHLARQTGLPLAFSGGIGWAASGAQTHSEAEVAQRVAERDGGVRFRWIETASRDTGENASILAPLLQQGGITRIALVTHAWHMPRSLANFDASGLHSTPAPMGFVLPVEHRVLEWLPSGLGLQTSRVVLREWLALASLRLSRALGREPAGRRDAALAYGAPA